MKFKDRLKAFFGLQDEEQSVSSVNEQQLRKLAAELEDELQRTRKLRQLTIDDIATVQATVNCQAELLSGQAVNVGEKWRAIVSDLNKNLIDEQRLYHQDLQRLVDLRDICQCQREKLAKQASVLQ